MLCSPYYVIDNSTSTIGSITAPPENFEMVVTTEREHSHAYSQIPQLLDHGHTTSNRKDNWNSKRNPIQNNPHRNKLKETFMYTKQQQNLRHAWRCVVQEHGSKAKRLLLYYLIRLINKWRKAAAIFTPTSTTRMTKNNTDSSLILIENKKNIDRAPILSQ